MFDFLNFCILIRQNRAKLNDKSPFSIFLVFYSESILVTLGILEIDVNKINLSPAFVEK